MIGNRVFLFTHKGLSGIKNEHNGLPIGGCFVHLLLLKSFVQILVCKNRKNRFESSFTLPKANYRSEKLTKNVDERNVNDGLKLKINVLY